MFALRGFPQVQLQYVARFVYRVAIFVSLCYFQRNFLVADGAAGEFVGLGNQAGIGLRCTCFVTAMHLHRKRKGDVEKAEH